MLRFLLALVASAFFGAVIVGCHAEAGGSVGKNDTSMVVPAH